MWRIPFLLMVSLFATQAGAAPTFTTLVDPIFAQALPGPDGFLGTADDVAAPGVNASGAATHVEFNDVSPVAGTNFFSFSSGTVTINEPLVAVGGTIAVTDFDISLSNTQTNGFTSTSVDVPSVLPHEIVYEFPGPIDANYTLRNVLSVGTLEADLSLAGFTLLPGVDPSLLPGISQPTADYLSLLASIAPTGWTAISLTVSPPTAITSMNTRGSLAPLFIGGAARGVTALYTSDPLNVVPEPSLGVLTAFGLLVVLVRVRTIARQLGKTSA